MRYCIHCGQELVEGASFCSSCGAPAKAESLVPASEMSPVFQREPNQEERELIEATHRFLRWERKAWSIASKVFIIAGTVFAAIYMVVILIGILFILDGDGTAGGLLMGFGITYALILGGMFIAVGIVEKIAADKIPQYLDTVYTDFSLAYNRCNSVGMLVFTILFGEVASIFFIINFVRMKSNRAIIERIIRKQNVPG